MAKHAAAKVATKLEPTPVKAAVKGVSMVKKSHAAPPSAYSRRDRLAGRNTDAGEFVARHSAPDSAYSRRERASGRNSDTPSESAKKSSGRSGNTRYVGKGSLRPTRSSRTHYIRYLGKDEADNTNRLIAEWIGGVALITIGVITKSGKDGYAKTVTTVMWRLTALTAVFFVLALLANGKGGKTAVYAGGLIDLAILYKSVSEDTIKDITKMFVGQALGDGTLAKDINEGGPQDTGGLLGGNVATPHASGDAGGIPAPGAPVPS